MQTAPALDLTSDLQRPIVRINHVDYDLRTIDDFTAVELYHVDRMLPRVVPLAARLETGDATEQECEELSAVLTALLKIVFAAPAEVIEKLGDVQKVKVFRVFIDLLPPSLRDARASLEASPQPGTKSSRGSRGSIRATSPRGRPESR